jgi:hypothetical protein
MKLTNEKFNDNTKK